MRRRNRTERRRQKQPGDFLVHRAEWAGRAVLVDCNRLRQADDSGFIALLHRSLGGQGDSTLEAIEAAIADRLESGPDGLCLIFDRFEAISAQQYPLLATNLRSLRDAFKYRLTLVTISRHPPDAGDELAELFYGNTFWLGPLSTSDAAWTIARFEQRKQLSWSAPDRASLIALSGAYPALLRGMCEAFAKGCPLDPIALAEHPAVAQRLVEFWVDPPTTQALQQSKLTTIPLLAKPASAKSDTRARLTAKERLLLDTLEQSGGAIISRDALIQAVWPEDQIYSAGVRDDSLAQLIRRLRKKIEADPSNPSLIHTIPGRGYTYGGS